jgi:hypothetical protein
MADPEGIEEMSPDDEFICEIASPLDAAGWRLMREGNELQAFCPGCFPLAGAETTRGGV